MRWNELRQKVGEEMLWKEIKSVDPSIDWSWLTNLWLKQTNSTGTLIKSWWFWRIQIGAIRNKVAHHFRKWPDECSTSDKLRKKRAENTNTHTMRTEKSRVEETTVKKHANRTLSPIKKKACRPFRTAFLPTRTTMASTSTITITINPV